MSATNNYILLDGFANYLEDEIGLSPVTIDCYHLDTKYFLESGINPASANQQSIKDFLDKQDAAPSTKNRRLASVRRFYCYLVKAGLVTDNPTAGIRYYRIEKQRPAVPGILTEGDVKRLLSAPHTGHPVNRYEFRDAVILHLMYSCALTVSEAINLDMNTLHLCGSAQSVLRVKSVYNGQPRSIPLGEEVSSLCREYISTIRPLFPSSANHSLLFPSNRGAALTRQMVWTFIQKYAQRTGIAKHISCQTLRNSFAKHLLEHAVQPKEVKAVLGTLNINYGNRAF